jgi:hypothetical protein
LSPLLANIALSVLDEHAHRPWLTGGVMSTPRRRARRRAKGLPNWRIVRYADDFVILVHGARHDAETLRDDIACVLAPLGLRLSQAKSRIVHISEGLDFLEFRIQWRRKRGTSKWYVYTVDAAIFTPSPAGSPWILRYPQPGFSRAGRRTRAWMFRRVVGRPVLPRRDLAAQRRRTISLCQRTLVSGVTSSLSPWRRVFGITPRRVASRARSAQFSFGRRGCRRCRTAS